MIRALPPPCRGACRAEQTRNTQPPSMSSFPPTRLHLETPYPPPTSPPTFASHRPASVLDTKRNPIQLHRCRLTAFFPSCMRSAGGIAAGGSNWVGRRALAGFADNEPPSDASIGRQGNSARSHVGMVNIGLLYRGSRRLTSSERMHDMI